MAADEDVRWRPVVGEYGVLLTEMVSMEELSIAIKSHPRIKVCDRVFVFVVSDTIRRVNFNTKGTYNSLFKVTSIQLGRLSSKSD